MKAHTYILYKVTILTNVTNLIIQNHVHLTQFGPRGWRLQINAKHHSSHKIFHQQAIALYRTTTEQRG